MRQLLKKYSRKLLPTGVVHYLKDRNERRFLTATSKHRCVVETEGDAVRCRLDAARSFLAPDGCRSVLEYFAATPQGRTEFDALIDAAEKAKVAFDIGAHSGQVSAMWCAANPALRVFGFEPSPLLCRRLEATVALNGYEDRLSIQPIGIGAEAATTEMLIDPAGGFVQTQRFEHSMWAQPEAIQIRLETIAGAAERLGVIPDLIKIDIEGYEYEAIEGSLAFLKQHRPTILLEVHLNYLEQRQRSVRTLVEMLQEVGYALTTYSGRTLRPAQVYLSPLATLHLRLQRK